MKWTALSIFMVLGLSAQGAYADLKLGDALPKGDVKMQNIDDSKVSINDVKGKKGTLVVFSCNHCPYAKGWESRLVALAADAKKKDVGFIMINSNDPSQYPEDGFAAMKKKNYLFPYVVDSTSEIAKFYGATKTPDVFLFDQKSKLVYRGAVDDNVESADKVTQHFLQDALNQLVAGQKIALAETKAVGCGIKFR